MAEEKTDPHTIAYVTNLRVKYIDGAGHLELLLDNGKVARLTSVDVSDDQGAAWQGPIADADLAKEEAAHAEADKTE